MNGNRRLWLFGVLFSCTITLIFGQQDRGASVEGNVNNLPVREYKITIDQEKVTKAKGKETMGMTVNGGIPGPTLEFTEG